MKKSIYLLGRLILVAWAMHAALENAAAQTEPGKPPPFLVDVKISTGLFFPAGSGGIAPANIQSAQWYSYNNADTRTMTVTLINTSGKAREKIRVEYAMYKIDQFGVFKEMVKRADVISLTPMERKHLIAQGGLNTNVTDNMPVARSDQYHGWAVKVILDGQLVHEKYSAPNLKEKIKSLETR